jgi:hypothetical protein
MNRIPGVRNLIVLMFVCLVFPGLCQARPDASVKFSTIRAENPKEGKEFLILPYAFPSDSMGTTGGIGAMIKGYGQKQLLIGATAFGSADGAAAFIGGLWDYQLPWFERFFFSTMGSVGHYPRQRAYTQLPRTGSESDAGGNDSSEYNYVEEEGQDNWFEFKFEYVLPMGSMKNKSIAEYHLTDGLLTSGATGGDFWNPLETGITVLMLKQFNRYQDYESATGTVEGTIHPLEASIFYNNTDFASNPSKGSSQYFGITHDNGWLDSKDKWTFIEFEASKFFDMGESSRARQRVVALNFWTGDSPTYDVHTDGSGQSVVSNSPPFLEGSRLGGFYRMRAYPNNRFNDRSVIYTSAEYRYTPRWNPIADVSWLKFLKMDWFQVVGFVEGGRVANEYSLSKLFSDWKVDAGIGLRAMMAGGVVRFDVAGGEEGATAWVMFNQPF